VVSSTASIFAIALLAAVAALLLATLGEWMHAKRTARIARLAFGETGRPARWTVIAPFVRVLGLTLTAFGAAILFQFDPIESDDTPNPRASRQLLVVLDVSPSMNLKDSGPDTEKIMRGVWAGKVLQGILDRIDMKDTRISLIAFYTKALPMLQDTTDKNLLPNLMDGLPLYTAFKSGDTDMQSGIDAAFAMAKGWARGSTTLVVISDGDLTKTVNPGPRPASIADVIVIGVGDPVRGMVLSGHNSRQDAWVLKTLAGRLDGYYHDGNTKHLPSEIIDQLTMIAPRVGDVLSLREAGLVALGFGCAALGLIGPLLLWFGTPRGYAAALRDTSAADQRIQRISVKSPTLESRLT
jgi:Ca-activated chloride channel family protein